MLLVLILQLQALVMVLALGLLILLLDLPIPRQVLLPEENLQPQRALPKQVPLVSLQLVRLAA